MKAEELLRQAQVHHQKGELQQAAKIYQDLLQHAPAPVVHFLYGQLLASQRQFDASEQHLRVAATEAPHNKDFQFHYARVLIAREKWPEALAQIEALLKQVGPNPMLLAELASLHAKMGDNKARIECYEQLIKLEAGNPLVLYNFANALREDDHVDRAITHYKLALEKKKDFPEALANLGLCYLVTKQYQDAVHVLRQSLALRPDHPETVLALIEAYFVNEDYIACVQTAEGYQKAFGAEEKTLQLMIRSLYELHRFEAAETACKTLIELNPNALTANAILGSIYCKQGKVDQGLPLLELACQQGDAGLKLTFESLIQYADTAKNESLSSLAQQASTLFETSEENSREIAALAFGLSEHYLKLGQKDQAYRWLDAANQKAKSFYAYDREATEAQFARIKHIYSPDYLKSFSTKVSQAQETRPIFVIGMPRSGTTLVEQILATHDSVTGCGELGYLDSLQEYYKLDEIFATKGNATENIQLIGKQYIELVHEHFKVSHSFVDKMPTNFLNLGLIACAFPEAKIVWCRRDPLATCMSIYHSHFVGAHPYAYSVDDIAHYYACYESLMAHWQVCLGDRIYSLVYEDFVADPECQAPRLFSYCELDYPEDALNFYQQTNVISTASAAQVKKPIYKSSANAREKYGPYADAMSAALERAL